MKLNELAVDSSLQLEFEAGAEKLYLDVQIAQVSKSGLILYPVIIDGKALSFKNNENVINLVYLQREGKPLLWKKVAVSNAVINGRNFVLVRSVLDGVEYNRRNNYRLPLDIKGNIAGYGDVLIRDISNNGLGFVISKDSPRCTIGQTVKINFSARNINYTISVTVARTVEEETRVLYGCKMTSTPVIDQFISEEQRIRIKGF